MWLVNGLRILENFFKANISSPIFVLYCSYWEHLNKIHVHEPPREENKNVLSAKIALIVSLGIFSESGWITFRNYTHHSMKVTSINSVLSHPYLLSKILLNTPIPNMSRKRAVAWNLFQCRLICCFAKSKYNKDRGTWDAAGFLAF